MANFVNYISDAFNELKVNVTWPKWSEVQRLTIIVAVFSILFSLLIWGIDTVFIKALEGFFNLIK
jgi:preprotein translocase subunit SecE